MLLPQFKTDDQDLSLMQNRWASILNPLLSNPSLNSSILKNVSLSTGSNIIPHRLGRVLQGWRIVRQRASASIYDNQDNNQMPQFNLTLVSSAPVTVDLEVF
jgi:hypothetical protein